MDHQEAAHGSSTHGDGDPIRGDVVREDGDGRESGPRARPPEPRISLELPELGADGPAEPEWPVAGREASPSRVARSGGRAGGDDAGGGEFNLVDAWWIVRRRRWLVLTCGALVALAVAVAVLLRPRVYSSYATLRIDDSQGKVTAIDLLNDNNSEIETEMEMLGSTLVAGAAADSLGLRLTVTAPAGVPRSAVFSDVHLRPTAPGDTAQPAYLFVREDSAHMQLRDAATGQALGQVKAGDVVSVPGAAFRLSPTALQYPQLAWTVLTADAAAAEVAGGLDISVASRGANLVKVAYTAADPIEAQAVPNAVVAAYIRDRVRASQSGAHSTAELLREQVAKLSGQLQGAEDSLRRYSEAHGIVSLPDEASAGVNRTAELKAQRNAIAAERAALAELVTRTVGDSARPRPPGAPSPYRSLIAFPTLLRNDAAAGLLRSISTVEEQRTALLARRSPTDPEVRFLDDRVAQLEGQLAQVVKTYLAGLGNEVSAFDATIRQANRQLAAVPRKTEEFNRLDRRVKDLQAVVTQLQTRLKEAEVAEAVEDPTVRAVDVAQLPTAPLSRHVALFGAAGLVAGLMLGLLVAFLREYFDETVHSRGDLLVATGSPIVGLVPRIGQRQKALLATGAGRPPGGGRRKQRPLPARKRASLLEQRAMLSEAYDQIETNIALTYPSRNIKVLMVTSALPGDGKTTSATNLALALAQRGERVVLIDADLRLGTVASVFRVAREPGLAEVLSGESTLENAIRTLDLGGGRALYYLTSGRLPSRPGQLLKSARMLATLQRLREGCDKVVLDSPPLNVVADAAVLGRLVDGVVVVARAGNTPFDALVSASDACRHARVPVVGTVLNDIDFDREASYDRAYHWYGLSRKYYAAAAARATS